MFVTVLFCNFCQFHLQLSLEKFIVLLREKLWVDCTAGRVSAPSGANLVELADIRASNKTPLSMPI